MAEHGKLGQGLSFSFRFVFDGLGKPIEVRAFYRACDMLAKDHRARLWAEERSHEVGKRKLSVLGEEVEERRCVNRGEFTLERC